MAVRHQVISTLLQSILNSPNAEIDAFQLVTYISHASFTSASSLLLFFFGAFLWCITIFYGTPLSLWQPSAARQNMHYATLVFW